jgi:hypothetical protein
MRDRLTTAATMVCLLLLAVGVGAKWGWELGLIVFGLLGAGVSELEGMK